VARVASDLSDYRDVGGAYRVEGRALDLSSLPDTSLLGFVLVALSFSSALLSTFSIWWRHRIHRQNVDRVSAMVESMAQQGCSQEVDAAAVLRAVRPPTLSLRRVSGDYNSPE